MSTDSIPHTPPQTALGYLWLHLPSGAVGVQPIARHPDGGPIAVHTLQRHGTNRILLAPTTQDTNDRTTWSTRTTTDAEAAARDHGWHPITRKQAIDLLTSQGYRLRASTEPGHVLHSDQADDLTWHPRRLLNGRTDHHQQATFVVRAETNTDP